jgi:hypothetical protein
MSSYDSLAILPNVYDTVDETAPFLGAALLDLSSHQKEREAELVADWFAASIPSLEEIWDNEEDAIYDHL